MSTYISAFQPVTYTLENGIYSSILKQSGVDVVLPSSSIIPTPTTIQPFLQPTTTLIPSSIPITNDGVIPPKKPAKFVDPFDPEATVPLPFQLDDQFGPYSTSVWKRNERERCRVRCVNEGYDQLRLRLPLHQGEKRISKVDTLRLAIRYIRHLDQLLKNHLHEYNCKCFDGFQEESEGNIQVNLHTL